VIAGLATVVGRLQTRDQGHAIISSDGRPHALLQLSLAG
jgi:hypothetical protein